MKKNLLTVFAVGLFMAHMSATPAAAMPRGCVCVTTPVDLSDAAEKAVNSVVYIKVTSHTTIQSYSSPFDEFFGDFFGFGGGGGSRRPGTQREQKSAGSGVILSEDGYIVTNNHVVENADELTVTLNDNREFKGRIIGTDKATDLALVKVEATGLPAITIGDSENIRLGEWVLAIGNPFGLTSTVTAGIVSAKARALGNTRTRTQEQVSGIENYIQTDAAINSGNSGGALVNAKGELIGINAMIYSQTGSYTGYGFAIPTAIMNKVVADLKTYGNVQRAVLGIKGMDVPNYIAEEMRRGNAVNLGTLNGVYVTEVYEQSSAEDAGLKAGDIITAIDGKDIEKMSILQEVIVTHNPGDKINVTFLRDKKKHTATVTLRNVQGTYSIIENMDSEKMGAGLRPLTDKELQELGLKYGLVVTAVKKGKMQEAGITKGIIITQVNDKQMRTLGDFDEAVRTAYMSNDRVLWIRAKTQSGLNRSFTVELTEPTPANPKKK